MKHRRLDADWDYCFGHGKQDYLEGREAVAQAIKTRLLLLYGEWWEDQEDGLPLFQKILAGSARESNLEAIDLIFRERIGNTPGVLAILRFDSVRTNGIMSLTATWRPSMGHCTSAT